MLFSKILESAGQVNKCSFSTFALYLNPVMISHVKLDNPYHPLTLLPHFSLSLSLIVLELSISTFP